MSGDPGGGVAGAERLHAFFRDQLDGLQAVIHCAPFTLLLSPAHLESPTPTALPDAPLASAADARLELARAIFGALQWWPQRAPTPASASARAGTCSPTSRATPTVPTAGGNSG